MKQIYIQAISVVFVIIITANLILMILGKIKPIVFWIVIILSALVAYKGIPYVKNHHS